MVLFLFLVDFRTPGVETGRRAGLFPRVDFLVAFALFALLVFFALPAGVIVCADTKSTNAKQRKEATTRLGTGWFT